MDIKLRKFALFAFFESLVLGILFVWLFTWKPVGISFAIYSFSILVCIISTLIFVEGRDFVKRLNNWGLLLLPVFLTSFVFTFRLSHDAMLFAFVSLPLFYAFVLMGSLNKRLFDNFGLLSFIVTPIILFVSWFVDLFNFARNLKFGNNFSPKIKSISSRIFIGFILALPILFIFSVLLYSADSVFAQLVNKFWESNILIWFNDAQTLLENLAKLFIAFFVAVLTMVFKFSLYNKDSFLNKMIEKTDWMRLTTWKKGWDVVVSTTFMFLINILFISFLAVQFTYLFGGEKNINGLNLTMTYAEYARRGFMELIVLSSIVFVIAFILNYKVYTKGFWQNLFYRANHIFMVLSVLIISYSANSRLVLYESAYGYTNLRLFVHLIILSVALMYIFLYISLLLKKSEQFVNIAIASIIMTLYLTLVLLPFDFISSKLNYQRYLKTGQIDFVYLFNRSSEAIPVMSDMVNDSNVSDSVKELLYANLFSRFEKDIENKRTQWQSYNMLFDRMAYYKQKAKLDKAVDIYDAQTSVLNFVSDYEKALISGDFNKAFKDYWSQNTKIINRGDVGMNILKYTPRKKTLTLSEWVYRPSVKYVTIVIDVDYSFDKSPSNAYFPEYTTQSETLFLRNYDGVWKVVDSDVIKLGGIGYELDQYKGWRHLPGYLMDSRLYD